MQESKNDLYILTETREEVLWQESIFVFDSSALLDLYFLHELTRTKIFNNIFKKVLKNRLWIPHHVLFEYNKNREKVIKKPITEVYSPLEKNIKSIQTSLKDINNKINDLISKTEKDDRHPYLPQMEINLFSNTMGTVLKEYETFNKAVEGHIDQAKEKINLLPENDDVLKAVESLFQIGRYYTFEEELIITKEGVHRFAYSIPPGYEDLKDNQKKARKYLEI